MAHDLVAVRSNFFINMGRPDFISARANGDMNSMVFILKLLVCPAEYLLSTTFLSTIYTLFRYLPS